MPSDPIDSVDRRILYHLQDDARRPITRIADAVGVADNTVRSRIEKLENRGVIEGYSADVNYGEADVQHHYMFVCTARVSEREGLAEEAAEIPGIVRVTTVMTGVQNVVFEAAGPSKREISEIARSIDELGLTIEREHLVWDESRVPYTGFLDGNPE